MIKRGERMKAAMSDRAVGCRLSQARRGNRQVAPLSVAAIFSCGVQNYLGDFRTRIRLDLCCLTRRQLSSHLCDGLWGVVSHGHQFPDDRLQVERGVASDLPERA